MDSSVVSAPTSTPAQATAPVGRLAPSPTGALHLGNARSFLLAWLSIRSRNGTLLMRIEDIDSPRVKSWAIQQTLDDLRWLGLDWDNDAPPEQLLQSTRLDRFRSVFEQLRSTGDIYACTCSRKDVESAASAPHDPDLPSLEGTVYPGTCAVKSKTRSLPDKHAWRWRFHAGGLRWHDQQLGEQVAVPSQQLGDFVIAKQTPEFLPAYQLAVVVDDHDTGITEVLRGDDLLCSTYRQVAILDALRWPRPTYRHVPLVVGSDGKRLAKRHGDTRLSTLADQGVTAESVVGFLAYSLGLLERCSPISARDLLASCSTGIHWSSIPQGPLDFDLQRDLEILRAMQHGV